MGLGAPKRRNKLSHDPNNTTWSKSADTYGHKILSSQGWKPGEYLGARNANHSDHYTAANASHIRILLREDNLGLGAEIGKGNAETFGLSLFSGVLGRLNGKSGAELQKQQFALRDAELRTYQAQKYGLMNFIRGGFLVGDRIQPVVEESAAESMKRTSAPNADEERPRAKKRRRTEDRPSQSTEDRKSNLKQESSQNSPTAAGTDSVDQKERKKSRKENQSRARPLEDGAAPVHVDESMVQQCKPSTNGVPERDRSGEAVKPKSKSPKRKDRAKMIETHTKAAKSIDEGIESERRRRKLEKRARKEDRRKRKEEKRRIKSKSESSESESPQRDQKETDTDSPSTAQSSVVANGGRHAIRQRYIQQKRMASMDPQAMKEIFMLKAVG